MIANLSLLRSEHKESFFQIQNADKMILGISLFSNVSCISSVGCISSVNLSVVAF